MMKWSFTKSICSALNFTLSTVELEQRLSLPSPLTTAPGYKNFLFLYSLASYLKGPLPQVRRILYFCIIIFLNSYPTDQFQRLLKFCIFCIFFAFFVFALCYKNFVISNKFCIIMLPYVREQDPWMKSSHPLYNICIGSLTNQITITNLFQAVWNLPRRSRLRSVLEVPRRKTEQVQLPTRTRLWLGTSNTFFFKTECLMSQLSHCLISHRLLLCCLWLIWLMTCTHCSVLIVLPSLLPTTCIWLASIVRLFKPLSCSGVPWLQVGGPGAWVLHQFRRCRWPADQIILITSLSPIPLQIGVKTHA